MPWRDRHVAHTVETWMENAERPNLTFDKSARLPVENAEEKVKVNLNFS